mgnify:FL=1
MGSKKTEIESIKLAQVYRLEVKEDKFKNFIRWGKKNDYNSYLVGLADNQAEHGAILNTKAKYLSGLGLESENVDLMKFCEVANPKESWFELKKKLDYDQEMYGARAIKIVPNLMGQPLFFYHIPYGNLRASKCETLYTYSDNWQGNEFEYPRTLYTPYKKGSKKVGIMVIKDYFPTDNLLKGIYGRPPYHSALVDIDTLVRISTYFNTLVQTKFDKSAVITIYDDNPTSEKKANISKGLIAEGGEEADKGALVLFARNGQKGAEIASFGGDNLDKQYETVTQALKEKLIVAHEINPALAGLAVDGKLGQTNKDELKNAHELYIKKWATPRQNTNLRLIETLFEMKTGINVKGQLKVKQLDWIGESIELNDALMSTALSRDEIRGLINEKYNANLEDLSKSKVQSSTTESINSLSPLVANKVLESMSKDEIRSLIGLKTEVIPQQELGLGNDFVSKLNMRDLNRMFKIVDNFHNPDKSQNLAQTIILLKAYGLTDEQAKEFIKKADEGQDTSHVQQSVSNRGCGCNVQLGDSKDNLFVKLAYQYAHDVNEDDEVLEIETVSETSVKLSSQVRLAGQALTLNQLRNAILNQFKGNPEVTAEEMSQMFNVEVQTVQEQIEWLVSKKLLESSTNGFGVSEKAINKKTKSPSEIYTEYYYDLRDGVSGSVILPTTRQFCKDMYKLHSENKKALTLKQIERIKNEFGDNAFVYSGGFWNNGSFTDVKCRHAWIGRTKIKRG